MPVATISAGLGYVLGAIISSLASIGISLASLGYSLEEQKRIEDAINKGKVSNADVINMISKIQDKAKVLGENQKNKLSKAVNGIFSNYSISSGESEKVLAPIQLRLEKLSDELTKLQSSAELNSARAEQAMNSYSMLSDKQKSKSQINDAVLYRTLSKKKNRTAHEDEQLRKLEEVHKNNPDWQNTYTFYNEMQSGGRYLTEAKQYAEQAASDYQKMAELTEKSM